LRINYSASSNNIVRNYLDENKIPDPTNTIWDSYFDIGEPNNHTQQLNVNYDLPINKLPFLSFVKSTYTYTGDYNWQRSSDAFSSIDGYDLGNTIQNAASHRLNTVLTMDNFYKYIGLTKQRRKAVPKANTPAPKAPVPGQKITQIQQAPEDKPNVIIDGLIGLATSVKNIQINYTDNGGTVLPGYLPKVGFFGTMQPSLGFIMGSQSDIRYEAAKNGWLTTYPEFNQSFTQVRNKLLDITAQVEPFNDLKIDLKELYYLHCL
jgi:cell surface protein SprA